MCLYHSYYYVNVNVIIDQLYMYTLSVINKYLIYPTKKYFWLDNGSNDSNPCQSSPPLWSATTSKFRALKN